MTHTVHVDLNLGWAKSLLSRMGMVKRKATTSSTDKKLTPQEFEAKKTYFLAHIKGMVDVHKIPADLII